MSSNDNNDGADGADPQLVAITRAVRERGHPVPFLDPEQVEVERQRADRDDRGSRG